MNATETSQRYRVSVGGLEGAVLHGSDVAEIGATEARWVTVNVRVPPQVVKKLSAGAHDLSFEIVSTAPPEARIVEKSTFIVPR